jgi:hypothetical protein
MDGQQQPEREVVHAREDIPDFASEEEERAWWAAHDIADELGCDVTEEQRARIRRAAQRSARRVHLQPMEAEVAPVPAA